ncbi:MAG: YXWGXW repeat-containing protein [Acidobacteria bacterium]|nr:YXWGXW repeat-containing protein [Acidobacteriota bacterium]
MMLAAPTSSLAIPTPSPARIAVGISVSFGPPALPIYVQPPCPAPGYIWVPGYWAWDPFYGYYWVPGTWVMAPFLGALWTPGYWAYSDGMYVWYDGYWGPVVGYYGGIYYGFGYTGYGYDGGYWRGDQFYYNRSVTNIRTTNITNVYEKTVVNNVNVTRVSYNGGPGGATARPTREQLAAENQQRSGPVASQIQHIQAAQGESRLRASENKGKPDVAATSKAGDFSGREVVRASRAGAPYVPPDPKAIRQNRGGDRSAPARVKPSDNRPARGGSAPKIERESKERPDRGGERPAPARIEPSDNRPERGGSAPNVDRAPKERPDRGGERPAPARIEPSDNRPERGGSAPNVDRAPKEHQPPPRAQQEAKPDKRSQPPAENRGGGKEHKPDKPHH